LIRLLVSSLAVTPHYGSAGGWTSARAALDGERRLAAALEIAA